MERATVQVWYAEEGWGVLESPSTPGGCWAHYSHIEMTGYRSLDAGDAVDFRWESADQDGYTYRATWVRKTK